MFNSAIDDLILGCKILTVLERGAKEFQNRIELHEDELKSIQTGYMRQMHISA
jgi:hypothetical protein